MSVSDLVNAALNLTSAILVGTGIYFIKKKNVRAHKSCMLAAVGVSLVFLVSYLFSHYHVGSVRFTKQGWLRNVYFPLLLSHTVLAAVIVPLVLRTAYLGLKERFVQHTRIARWTFSRLDVCVDYRRHCVSDPLPPLIIPSLSNS